MSDDPNKIILSAVALVSCGGIYFTALMANYGLGYYLDSASPVRTEYMQGVYLSLMFSLPFWVIATGLASDVKDKMPSIIYGSLKGVTFILGMAFLGSLLYAAIAAVA